MLLGLISDTHGLLRPEVAAHFSGVDLIVHAGDVGGAAIISGLSKIAPVLAVSGNVDDRHDPALPRHRSIPVEGLLLHVSHGDELGTPRPDVLLARYDADIVVYGHTHRAAVLRAGARLAVNPGAAGPRRFNLRPSIARLSVNGQSADVELIELS